MCTLYNEELCSTHRELDILGTVVYTFQTLHENPSKEVWCVSVVVVVVVMVLMVYVGVIWCRCSLT